jgi:sec-independent protein translocase protein TatA
VSGIFEILLVLAIILVLFGATRLPAVGSALGRMVRNFKSAQSSRDEIEVTTDEDKEKEDRKKIE